MTNVVIKLENVTKVFPDGTEAVKEVSLEVKKGNICVLLGTSGCGKTTTMKMINRLIPITSGKIYINGVDNTQINADELRRDIGYSIQSIGLFPHMTVGQNIETVPILKGWPKNKRRERARELLQMLRLDPDATIDKYPRELSGGQQQRVGVARALGADPPILLMDEPFGAIDPITRVELQEEFLKIQEDIQKTIIFVTHDVYEAIRIGDRIALMKNGRLVQYASPTELLFRPKDQFVADFLGADRALKGLQLIRVKEIMITSPPSITPDETIQAAQNRMTQNEVSWLVVVDREEKFLGWAIDANLPKGEIVKDVMIGSSLVTHPNSVLNEALSVMLSAKYTILPVVDRYNRVEGVLSFEAIQTELRGAIEAGEAEGTSRNHQGDSQ